jgi:hypothetical protein
MPVGDILHRRKTASPFTIGSLWSRSPTSNLRRDILPRTSAGMALVGTVSIGSKHTHLIWTTELRSG